MDRRNPTGSSKSMGWRLALGGLGCLALASGCSNRLDTSTVEATLKADIERQGRRLSLNAVRCPSDVTRQAGAYFRCVGELNPEGTFTINVTQQDTQGIITWEVPNSKALLNLPKVEDSIQQGLAKAFGKRALIDCGTATYRVNLPGDRFQCQVVGGIEAEATSIQSVLVSIDPDGNLSWQELRATPALAALPAASSQLGTPAAGQAAPGTTAAQVKTTTVTGPTGRVVKQPYIPGDDD
jgi:hypothetical protein